MAKDVKVGDIDKELSDDEALRCMQIVSLVEMDVHGNWSLTEAGRARLRELEERLAGMGPARDGQPPADKDKDKTVT